MKNFVKTMDRTSPAFRYLHVTFPRLSKAKSKERVFVDPHTLPSFPSGFLLWQLWYGQRRTWWPFL